MQQAFQSILKRPCVVVIVVHKAADPWEIRWKDDDPGTCLAQEAA
jgi:hypothetical protein